MSLPSVRGIARSETEPVVPVNCSPAPAFSEMAPLEDEYVFVPLSVPTAGPVVTPPSVAVTVIVSTNLPPCWNAIPSLVSV